MKTEYHLSALAALVGLFTAVDPALAQNWTASSAPQELWTSVVSSANSVNMVAVAGAPAAGNISTSTNLGATWIPTSAVAAPWNSVASSANGTKLAAATEGGLIYTSTNVGATWTPTSAPGGQWASVASSTDGSK